MSFQINSDKEELRGSQTKIVGSSNVILRTGAGADEKEVLRTELSQQTGLPRVGINRTGTRVETITLTSIGTGYNTVPTVEIEEPTGANGVRARATATINSDTGVVTNIIIDEPGSGYASTPAVSIFGGGGTGATAVAKLDTIDFELDITGAIRTSTSIISDTARILNLDVINFVTPNVQFRTPNLKTWANNTGQQFVPGVFLAKDQYRWYDGNIYQSLNEGDLGPSELNPQQNYPDHIDGVVKFGEVELKHIGFRADDQNLPFYRDTPPEGLFPRSITPLLGDRSDKIATTEYVLNLATNDVGGRIYVSAQIGDDNNDGRSAVNPVRTIKKAAQIASQTKGVKETLIISGGDYVEDNPISIPADCSIVGDNLRLVIVRPANPRKHMFKFGDKNYLTGLTFRDQIDSNGDPVATWDFAMVFDDKQRIYFDANVGGDFERQFPIGHQVFGEDRVRVPFQNNTGTTNLQAGLLIIGENTGSEGLIQQVIFETQTGNDAFVNGSIIADVTSGGFNAGETFLYGGPGAIRWTPSTTFQTGDIVWNLNNVYEVVAGGISDDETGPNHTSGTADDGTARLAFIRSAYEFVSLDVISVRPEGEVTDVGYDTTSVLPLVRVDFTKQEDPEVYAGGFGYDESEGSAGGGIVFYTSELIGRQNTHDFKEGQEVFIENLGPGLEFLEGYQRIYKILRDADGRSRRFVIAKKDLTLATSPGIISNIGENSSLPLTAKVSARSHYVTLTLLNSPNKFAIAESVARRYQDACNLIRQNVEFIKDETYLQVLDEFKGLSVPDETKCRRDIGHFLNALIMDLEYGSNNHIIEAANRYVQGTQIGYIPNEITETIRAFDIARRLAILAIRNWHTGSGAYSEPQYTAKYSALGYYTDPTVIEDTTLVNGVTCYNVSSAIDTLGYLYVDVISNEAEDRYLDASYLIGRNQELIVEEVIGAVSTAYPDFYYPGTDEDGYRFKDARNLIYANIDEIQDRALAQIAIDHPDFYFPGDPATDSHSRFNDAYRLIQQNKDEIVNTAWSTTVSNYPGVSSTETKCKRDLGYFVDAISLDVFLEGNKYARKFTLQYFDGGAPIGNGLEGEETESVFAFNQARDLMKQALANQLTVKDLTVTPDPATGSNTDPNSCANVQSAIDTLTFIVTSAISGGTVSGLPAENAGFYQTNEFKCRRDIGYVVKAVANDLYFGGNKNIILATQYYFTSDGLPIANGLFGEEAESVTAFNAAATWMKLAITNGLYEKDLTITADPITGSNADPASCANVQTAIDNLISIITDAVTNQNLSNLPAVATDIYATGEYKCMRDSRYVLGALRRDLTLGGNAGIVTVAEFYYTGSTLTGISQEELGPTLFAYQKLRELSILAMRNWKTGTDGTGAEYEPLYTIIPKYTDSTITVDPSTPICNDVKSSIDTEFDLLIDILDGTIQPGATVKTYGTLYDTTNILNFASSTIYDLNGGRVTVRADYDDLPYIEASPYTQNASVISFLGGSGAEVDGAKVQQPNCPFPGLELDGSATFPNQGKSVVAAAFTIITFGGIGYKILNDGYTQLVSVFVLFARYGILAESGGYASVTNSASNFGTYALAATGYRDEAYEFDVGIIGGVSATSTGRTQFAVQGLGRAPLEHYIVKIDGYRNANPEREWYIDEVGEVDEDFSTTITLDNGVGQPLSLIRESDNTPVSISAAELGNKTIRLHRPSIVNSSSHTWEYVGSGTDYNALPENGGTKIDANEQFSSNYGRVYASGTDELGDFKVGDFAKIENRTGAITFTGTVTISEVDFLKLKGGNTVITGFDNSSTLGGANASDEILPTQFAVRSFIVNNLGAYINKPYSTNAVPRALVELTDSGKISIDQIPALRPFQVYTIADEDERLSLEGALAGDIAIQTNENTEGGSPESFILNNDNSSLFLGFSPNANYQFINGNIYTGSLSGGQIQASEYREGVVYQVVITDPGEGYQQAPTVTISGGNPGLGATEAKAVATIASGQVVTVTLIEFNGLIGGEGYTTPPIIEFSAAPGSGRTATASLLLESRLYGNIVNNIKITDTDFFEDSAVPANTIDITRVVNTSASLATNWVSLSSNQISADDITSGTISTARLANNSAAANSFTFLRGDQAYAPVVQSLKGSEPRYFAQLISPAAAGQPNLVFSATGLITKGHSVLNNVVGIPEDTSVESVLTTGGTTTVELSENLTDPIAAGEIIEFNRGSSPIILDSTLPKLGFVEEIVIVNGGSGYTSKAEPYVNVSLSGGSGTDLKCNITVENGTVTNVVVTEGGSGYSSDFIVTPNPVVIGTGSGLILAAKVATVSKQFANVTIDVARVSGSTLSTDLFGTVGVSRFLKSQFDIATQGNGSVVLKTGADSGLDADLLDGVQGTYYLDGANFADGSITPEKLGSGTYQISITGQSGNTLRLNTTTTNASSDPVPSTYVGGVIADTRNNTANGLNDGGGTNIVLSIRTSGAGSNGSGVRQLAFTDNDNMWIRGSGVGSTAFGTWQKVWTSQNDYTAGNGEGPNALRLRGKQGEWYENAFNLNEGIISTNQLPSYQYQTQFQSSVSVSVFENLPRYKFYFPGKLLTSETFTPGGPAVLLYNAAGNGIGQVTILDRILYNDPNDNENDYTIIVGAFNAQGGLVSDGVELGTAIDSEKGITNYTLDDSGAGRYTAASLQSVAGDGRLVLGRNDNVGSSPAIHFNSGSTSSITYDSAIVASGGDGNEGSGALDVIVGNTDAFTVNSNVIWNAGNLLFSPGFDSSDPPVYDSNVNEYLVQRDSNGDFAANNITASLTGAASLNVLKTGDTMSGSLIISGANSNLQVGNDLTVNGDSALSGGLTVDATTLVVDATNNRVLIGQASGSYKLDVKLASAATTNGGDIGLRISGSAGENPGYVGLLLDEPNTSGDQDGYIALARTTGTAFLGMEIQNRGRDGIRFLTSVNKTTTPVERLRIGPTGTVTVKDAGTNFALDVEGTARVQKTLNLDSGNDNSGAFAAFLGSQTHRNFRIGNQLSGNGLLEITPSTLNGGSAYGSPALVIKGGGGVTAFTHNGIADPSRTALGSWTGVSGTTSPINGGTGATFNVTTNASGVPTIQINARGDNYQIGDTITLSGSTFGGGANIVITVTDILDGQVGIGTTVFSSTQTGGRIDYQLNVEGNVNFNGTLYQNNEPFITSRWTIATNGIDAYRLSKIGINKVDPVYELDVDGSIAINGSGKTLYANGIPQWVDDFGVIKTALNTISSNVVIPDNTNATSVGIINILNDAVVEIGENSTWVIL